MRKIIVILALVPLLAACVSFPKNPELHAKEIIYWDETIPKEQCVGLFVKYGISITSYNGVSVNWKNGTMVYLPAGNITFTVDIDYTAYYTIYIGENYPFEWTFEAGDIRYLSGWVKGGEPAIFVIDPNDKTEWERQPAYKFPRRTGTLILE